MDKVVHFELPADDMKRAKNFYSSIFDWQIKDWPMADGGVYVGARSVPVDEQTLTPKESGAINGGMVQRSAEVATPIITISVGSIDECLAKIEAIGGSTIKTRTAIPDMGYYAYAKDSEGNTIGLWEDKKG